MHTITHPTPAEIQAHLRRARTLRSNAVCAFFRRLIDRLGHRGHAAHTAKWA